jgi:hypothetical protein
MVESDYRMHGGETMPATFSRPDKLKDAGTIVYEIDMVRFAARRLLRGRWESDKDKWAYLECFLLHYRNLIEFLGREENLLQDTDLHVSNIWQRLEVPEPAQLRKIRGQGDKLWAKYERVRDKISRYLQHCTTLRTESKSWEVGTMCGELEAVLADVEKALRGYYQSWSAERPVVFLGAESNSTATVSTCAADVQSFSSPALTKAKK